MHMDNLKGTKNLKVYKASAGSGKTFILTVEFIKLLLANPDNYSRILAVTFTNKATNEMKERILYTLSKITKKDPDADDYLKKILEEKDGETNPLTHLPEDVIISRAKIALEKILHDYSRFRIETIDSFFQSIIRNLAHELSLTANLKVDLNQEEVLSDAVREIIENLQANQGMLFNAVKEFIDDKIESSKNWKINEDIEKFSKNIFNELFLSKEQEINKVVTDEKFFKKYKDQINDLREQKEKEIKAYAEQFFKICEANGFDQNSFYHKSSGLYKYFVNIQNGNFAEPNSYVMQNINREKEISTDSRVLAHEGEILRLLSETTDTVEKNKFTINTVALITQHLNQMRLLGAVNSMVRELNTKANRFLLAETAHFLNKMIGESDIPFIYEKSGSRFDHIMIDEFQDTSSLQWENFKPLLKNSMDGGHMCLVVGDVKQSIYRWRNTDWEILNKIDHNPDFESEIDLHPLETNYRSYQEVIDFNNSFFRNVIKEITGKDIEDKDKDKNDTDEEKGPFEEIYNAYRDVKQGTDDKHKGKGYVKVEVIDGENYKDESLKRLVTLIDELLNKGIRKEDICLLLRKNGQISQISSYFAKEKPEIKIVSNEAYKLSSSVAINIIILAMKYIANPNDRLTLATLVYTLGNDAPFMLQEEELRRLLPKDFLDSIDRLALTPLYELCHKIYNLFSLKEIPDQDAYLMTFFDQINEYVTNESIDINHFLTYWEDKLKDVNISSDSIDGIKAMTIHKSKGLEFHTVICPFFSWETACRADTLLWCEPSEAPFSKLPVTAVNYQNKTAESIFVDEYNTETVKNFVDHLNLLYVAFTRAKNNLFILTGKETGKENIYSIIQKGGILKDNETEKEFGELMQSKAKSDDDKKKMEKKEVRLIQTINTPTFRQSNKSMQFIGTLEDNENDEDRYKYINEGLILHRFFELIHTPEDTDQAILQLEEEGFFENEQYKKDALRLISKVWQDSRVKEWFNGNWTEFNECTIISLNDDGSYEEKRPDRVITDGKQTIVIDYKTGAYNTEHEGQVLEYMKLLQSMGYPNIKGYLWYIRRNEIKDVPQKPNEAK